MTMGYPGFGPYRPSAYADPYRMRRECGGSDEVIEGEFRVVDERALTAPSTAPAAAEEA